jgi:hypothetical protein
MVLSKVVAANTLLGNGVGGYDNRRTPLQYGWQRSGMDRNHFALGRVCQYFPPFQKMKS